MESQFFMSGVILITAIKQQIKNGILNNIRNCLNGILFISNCSNSFCVFYLLTTIPFHQESNINRFDTFVVVIFSGLPAALLHPISNHLTYTRANFICFFFIRAVANWVVWLIDGKKRSCFVLENELNMVGIREHFEFTSILCTNCYISWNNLYYGCRCHTLRLPPPPSPHAAASLLWAVCTMYVQCTIPQ